MFGEGKQKKILYGLLYLIGCILIINSYVAYRQAKFSSNIVPWMMNNYKTIIKTRGIFTSVINKNRSLLRYFTSGNKSFLKIYQNDLRNIDQSFLEAKAININSVETQGKVNLLEQLLQENAALIDQGFKIYQSQGRTAAIQFIVNDPYQKNVESIRVIIFSLIQDEYDVLDKRTQIEVSSLNHIQFFISMMGALSLLLIILFLMLIRHFEKVLLKTEAQRNLQIQETLRLKSEFLANMSHELRTPLNAVIGFSELIYDEKVGPISMEQKEYLGDILSSSHNLLRTINDILALANIDSGNTKINPRRVQTKKLVEEVQRNLNKLIQKKSLSVSVYISPSLNIITTDPIKFKQILFNYFSNAIKFTPLNGKIYIKIVPEDRKNLRLEIKDTGIGIKKSHQDKLFVEFQQLDESTGKKYQGTGLGLALTKHVIILMGGQYGVESTIGKGSIFYAILPRQYELTEDVQPNLHDSLLLTDPLSIMFVDDDTTALQQILQALKNESGKLKLFCQADPFLALHQIEKNPPDMIILDLIMPHFNGFSFLYALKKMPNAKNIPVIIWTAYDINQTERNLFSDYVQAIVKKQEHIHLLIKYIYQTLQISEEIEAV